MKRTTGIPRSFLKTVEKPTALANDGTSDEVKQPAGVMVNADGEWVIAEPDKASWDQYQAKAKVSAAAQQAAAHGDKNLQEKGLECPIDKRLFIEPTMTPCCQKTYCLECITNSLLENDLRCPSCNAENILIDDLKPDSQAVTEVQKYEQEQLANAKTDKARIAVDTAGSDASQEKQTSRTSSSPKQPQAVIKKRPAESQLVSTRSPRNPATETSEPAPSRRTPPKDKDKDPEPDAPSKSISNAPSASTGSHILPQAANPLVFPPTTSSMMPINMPQPMMMTGPNMYDPAMMTNPFLYPGGNNWNMWGPNPGQQPMGMAGVGMTGGMMQNGNYGFQNNMHMPTANGFGASGMMQNVPAFMNQQQNQFTNAGAAEEDSAYFRKPVNPYRHQGRRNVNRPTDYREI